jgi:Domain of Unknown Function (DUF1206)
VSPRDTATDGDTDRNTDQDADSAPERVAEEAEDTAQDVQHHPVTQALGRYGDVCYGVMHIVVAVLAIRLVFGRPGHAVDQKGAIAAIATQPLGVVALWLLAIGLAAFGLWQLLCAAIGFTWVTGRGARIGKRIGTVCRATAVLAIAVSTIRLLVSSTNGRNSNGESRTFTAKLMSVTGGRILVAAVGVGIVVTAVVIGWRGIHRKFVADLDLSRVSPASARLTESLGVFGLAAKAVVYAIVGVLILIAAIQFDPKKAGGLDAALRTLAAQPLGIFLLVVVALGLAAYGGYCFFESRCRRG